MTIDFNNMMDDQFFDAPTQESTEFNYTQTTSSPSPQTFDMDFGQPDPALELMRKEEERIQQNLRQKADREYGLKTARKEAGKAQYEEFVTKKQAQVAARKADNLEKEKKFIEDSRLLNQKAGWAKVAANVHLKQGDVAQGSRNLKRLRESIINKIADQKQE